ncbi:MAG: 4a-hydroxytetrahydrobiopterin dehydratase [Pseudoxanthomonas sp.]
MPTLEALASAHCRPLSGPGHLLAPAAVHEHLAVLPAWQLVEDGKAISRRFKFPDYYRTMAFVNALAHVAHREDHHPDLGVHYGHVDVRYATHDVGGLSENDFICAARTDALLD